MSKQYKRGAPYIGDDVADYTHNNKSHRSTSEAFRDVNYANAFEHDAGMSDCKMFLSEMAMLIAPLVIFGFFVYWLINALVEVTK
jgi:hypothetical protein